MLNFYHIDTSNLTPNEREQIYQKLEKICYTIDFDVKNFACEVYLEKKYDLESLIDFPDSCIITRY